VKYKIVCKSQQYPPTTTWKFAVIPRESYRYCGRCKTFPFCPIIHNSGYRYKSCPCPKCVIKVICHKQCDKFEKQVTELFKMKIHSDYKDYWFSILEKPII
jgi:hypothetical protein